MKTNVKFWTLVGMSVFSAFGSLNAISLNYQIVVQQGDSRQGGFVFSDLDERPGINNAGQVIFAGTVNPSLDGIWVATAGDLAPVAIEDGAVPGISGAKYDYFSGDLKGLTLADDGQVLFLSVIKGSGIRATNDASLWVGLPGALQLVMREGSLAPGGGGRTFLEPSSTGADFYPIRLQENGVVGFYGRLSGASGPLNDRSGIWTGIAGAVTPALLSNQATDHGQITSIYSELSLAPDGTAYTSAATGVGAWGLWRAKAGTATRLFAKGQVAPGTGELVFGSLFYDLFFSAPNFLAFNTTVNHPTEGAVVASFAGPEAGVTALLVQNTQAPGLAGPKLFTSSGTHINPAGGKVFAASLVLEGSVTTANDSLLYYLAPGAGPSQAQIIAREGDPVPGITNAVWGGPFFDAFFTLNDSGNVAFENQLTGPGVTASTDGTLWIWEAATGVLTLVAREGTPIDFGGGNVRTPRDLTYRFRGGPGRSAGLTSGMNKRNQIAFLVYFTDFKEAIVVASPPITFAAWALNEGLTGADADFLVDSDFDGAPNGLEFVRGSRPKSAASRPVLPLPEQDAAGRATYRFGKAAGVRGITFAVRWSESLGTSLTSTGLTIIEDSNSELEVRTESAVSKAFFQGQISLSPP